MVNEYVRPALPVREYRDSDGAVIPYGHRWSGSPPDDAYSELHDADRYEPLHTVALALRDWMHEVGESKVELELTDFPGVILRAGQAYSARFPACGCDACDEDVMGLIDDLEKQVIAIATGRLEEESTGSAYHYRLVGDDWELSGTTYSD